MADVRSAVPSVHSSGGSRRVQRIGVHVLIGATAALATAALHLTIVTVSRDVMAKYTWLWASQDVVWMLPLGYLAVFAAIGLVFGLAAALRRYDFSARTIVWIWASISLFSLGLLFQRIHTLAWAALALGVGSQIARLAAARPLTAQRVLRRSGMGLAIGFALLISLVVGQRAWAIHRATVTSARSESTAPNVLLIVWDASRARNFSLYGHRRLTTPFLDSLARVGIVFDRAIATASWTLPSHASMFTGRYASQQTGDRLSPMNGEHPTLAEVFRQHGYATGGFVANLQYAAYATGLQRGFSQYEDTRRSLGEVFVNTTLTQSHSILGAVQTYRQQRWLGGALRRAARFDGRPFGGMFPWPASRRAAEITDGFLRWERRRNGQPFFAFLNYMEVHDPHLAPRRNHFANGATTHDRYDGALLSLDDELRRLVHALSARGILDRTVIVLTSDHGELINEHGLNGHSTSLYLNTIHVPLVIQAPRHRAAGTRVPQVVSLRDLPATILGLAQIGDQTIPGANLLQLNSASQSPVELSPAISEVSVGINDQPPSRTYYGDLIGVIDDSMHIIRDGTGAYQVFAYQSDPEEQNDLARDPRVAAWARERIAQVLERFELRSPRTTHVDSTHRQ